METFKFKCLSIPGKKMNSEKSLLLLMCNLLLEYYRKNDSKKRNSSDTKRKRRVNEIHSTEVMFIRRNIYYSTLKIKNHTFP